MQEKNQLFNIYLKERIFLQAKLRNLQLLC